MRKLVVKDGSAAHEYALLEPTIIGRGESSTIRLDASKVADEHAKISRTGPNIFVEDLDTPHGITVNGKKVARWALKKGDLIGVGAVTLLYDEDDKPEPAPKPKEPPKPKEATKPAKAEDSGKSATGVKPEKKIAPSAGSASTSKILPAVKAPANGNGNGNGTHGKSAAGMPAAKAKADAAAPSPVSASPSPSPAPKPVGDAPSGGEKGPSDKGAGEKSSTSASSKSSIVSAVVAKSGSSRSSAKTSQSLGAVVVPSSLNDGNSSRINLALPKSSASGSSAGMRGVSDSPGMGSGAGGMSGMGGMGGMGSKSGITSAVTSGKRPDGKTGSSHESSARMSSASAAAILAQRIANAPAQAAGARETQAPGSKTLLIAVGVLGFVVVVLLAVLIVSWSRGRSGSAEDRATLERLHAPGAKTSDDLQLVIPRLRAAHQPQDVYDILGEPDLKFKDEVPLWDPQMGAAKCTGQAFFAYYIKAQGEPSAIEESPMASVLLFQVTDGRVEFIGPKNYSRFASDPDKKDGVPNNPAISKPTPLPMMPKPVVPNIVPKVMAPPAGPALPMPDDKPPTARPK